MDSESGAAHPRGRPSSRVRSSGYLNSGAETETETVATATRRTRRRQRSDSVWSMSQGSWLLMHAAAAIAVVVVVAIVAVGDFASVANVVVVAAAVGAVAIVAVKNSLRCQLIFFYSSILVIL